MKTTVGTSSRTPFKHWVLDTELGRICGVLSTGKVHAKDCPFHVIDLCAGDGHKADAASQPSPAIIEKHCRWARSRNLSVKATLIEQSVITFSKLCQNTNDWLWMEKLNMDARDWKLVPRDKHQAVFIHADPNTISDWPITKELLSVMPETTTMLATLGCNVGGLKRLSLEDRLPWFDHVNGCLNAMPRYHDAILIELVRDASQWAYLLRLPHVWTNDTITRLVKQGGNYTNYELNIASIRNSRDGFEAMQIRLFLTKSERGEA